MLIHADARSIPLPDEHVDCVVTSPPYWGLRDYGVDGQIGLEATPALYVTAMVEVFREVRRLLKPAGVLWLNLGDCYATGAGKVGDHPGGGEQGARWRGDVDRPRDAKRGYRGGSMPNGHGYEHDRPKMQGVGQVTQPNRMPIEGLKPKDLVGIPWRVAFALQADGWWLRSDVIWHKPNPMPESVTDRPTKAHEYVFLLSKSERYYYDQAAIRERYEYGRDHTRHVDNPPESHMPGTPKHTGLRRSGNRARVPRPGPADSASHQSGHVPWVEGDSGRNARSVWTIATKPYKGAHFATFPPELVRRCILAGCPAGGTVLDPFVGSGTTVKVARELGREGIGIDINPKYLDEQASKRIKTDRGFAFQKGTA